MDEVYTRGREYRRFTDAIEYRVEHYEHRYPMPDPPSQCDGFITFTIADTNINYIPCLVSNNNAEEEEYYYQCKEQQFITAVHFHCPDISTTCAAKIADTFMEILLIANAAHRCPEWARGGVGGFTTSHDVYIDILPRSSSSHHEVEAVEELVVCEVDEDNDVIFPARRPATRASIAELLKARVMEEGGGECGICMEEMELRNRVGMPCSHSFHRVCLLEWLNNSHSCPICRYQMPAAQYRSSGTEDQT